MKTRDKIIAAFLAVSPVVLVSVSIFINSFFVGSSTIGSPYYNICLVQMLCEDGSGCGYTQKMNAPLYCPVSHILRYNSGYIFLLSIIIGIVLMLIFYEKSKFEDTISGDSNAYPEVEKRVSRFGFLSGISLSLFYLIASFYIATRNPYNFFALIHIVILFIVFNSISLVGFKNNKRVSYGLKSGFILAPLALTPILLRIFG